MNFAYVENNEIKEFFNGGLPTSWKTFSGLHHSQNDLEFLKSIGILPMREVVPDYDKSTQTLLGPNWEINENEIVGTYTVQNRPSEEFVQRRKEYMNKVRETRNGLLYQSDWALVSDVISIKGQEWVDLWTTYRQQLRDFPSTINIDDDPNPDFYRLVWPSAPDVTNT